MQKNGSNCANTNQTRACFLCSSLQPIYVRRGGAEKNVVEERIFFFFPLPATAVLGNRGTPWMCFPSPSGLMVWTPSAPALAHFKWEGGAFKYSACQPWPPGSFELIWCHRAFSPWPICLQKPECKKENAPFYEGLMCQTISWPGHLSSWSLRIIFTLWIL